MSSGSGDSSASSRRRSSASLGIPFDPFLEIRHMITLCGKAVQIHERRDPITGHLTRHLHVFATQSRRAQYGGGPFLESRSVLVIDEEVVYSEDNRSFTALILERPLMGHGDVPRIQGGEPLFYDDRPAEQWINLLRSIAKSDSVTHGVLKRADKLAKKVPAVIAEANGALADISMAAEDLHDTSWKLAETLVTGKVFGIAKNSSRLVEMLAEAMDMYIMFMAYPDTFNKYCMAMAKAEPVLMEVLFELREKSWKPEEIPPELVDVPLLRTVECLQGLNDARSPLAKLQCILSASRCIMADVNVHFQRIRDGEIRNEEDETCEDGGTGVGVSKENSSLAEERAKTETDAKKMKSSNPQLPRSSPKSTFHKRRPTPTPQSLCAIRSKAVLSRSRPMPSISEDYTKTVVIAADEMLPLFISAVCNAAPAAILANTLYMRELASETLRNGKLGYALAMWEAAVSFIGRNVWSELALGDRDFGAAQSENPVHVASRSVEVDSGGPDSASSANHEQNTEAQINDSKRASAQAHALNGSKEERDHWRFIHAVARAKLNAGKISEDEYTRIVTQYAAVPSPFDSRIDDNTSDISPLSNVGIASPIAPVAPAASPEGSSEPGSGVMHDQDDTPTLPQSPAQPSPVQADEATEPLVDPLAGLAFTRRPSFVGRQRSATSPAQINS